MYVCICREPFLAETIFERHKQLEPKRHDGNQKEDIIFDFSVTRAISSPCSFSTANQWTRKVAAAAELDTFFLSCTRHCVCLCKSVCPREEQHENKYTVRMVGVTKAQQILQNRFGWKPIIISMSSQNLCRPARRKGNGKKKRRRRSQWEETLGVTWV